MNKKQLEQRVIQIAEKVLKEQHYVSAIDILLGIGYLQPVHLDEWRRGRIPYLERFIQGSVDKNNYAMECFQHWAIQKSLKTSEIHYFARTREPNKALQFSKDGDPKIESVYRTHYFSPQLSEKRRLKLQEQLEKLPEQVVSSIIKDSNCDQCHKDLLKGSLLYKEQDKALCMKCAGFEDLVYLSAGNATLTRRVKLYSQQYAVVVRFSRTRKRYERQGLLVEEAALRRAESELKKKAGVAS